MDEKTKHTNDMDVCYLQKKIIYNLCQTGVQFHRTVELYSYSLQCIPLAT